MNKRFFSFLLALCLLLPMTAALAEIVYPLDTDVTLTVWMSLDAGNSQVYTNIGENPVYQEYQKKTGVEVEFIHPTYGAVAEGFSTVMAGDKLPDIMIEFDGHYNGGLLAAYDDGVIYDLAPYLEEYAPDYYALINSTPEIRREYYTEDGRCLAFAAVGDANAGSRPECLVLRADWCEEFGIDPAELKTFDDLEKYFQAVKDNKHGVIPFLAARDLTIEVLGMGYNVYPDFITMDGKVRYYADTDGFREFLKRLNSWYEKEYIGLDFGTVTKSAVRKMFSAGQVGSIVCAIGNACSDARVSGIPIAKPPFTQVNVGDPVHVYLRDDMNSGKRTVITTSLDEKLLPVAMEMLNYAYTDEGAVLANWGAEGISWEWVDGERKHTDWVIHNENYETSIMQHVCRASNWPSLVFDTTTCCANLLVDEYTLEMRLLYADMENWDAAWKLPSGVSLTVDENNERAKYMTDVKTYVSEMHMRFITGEADIDTEWDGYVEQLNKYGLEKAVEITQAAYDRYMNR